jgi:hypothetical protein
MSGIDKDDDRQTWVFDPKTVFAEVKSDEDGLPVLVIGDGDSVIEVPAGRHEVDPLAAARRISEKVWEYVLAVKMRGLKTEQRDGAAAETSDSGGATEPDGLHHFAGNSGPGWPYPGPR